MQESSRLGRGYRQKAKCVIFMVTCSCCEAILFVVQDASAGVWWKIIYPIKGKTSGIKPPSGGVLIFFFIALLVKQHFWRWGRAALHHWQQLVLLSDLSDRRRPSMDCEGEGVFDDCSEGWSIKPPASWLTPPGERCWAGSKGVGPHGLLTKPGGVSQPSVKLVH